MQIVCLGDLHGRTIWKQIVANHPKADRYVFIGDYVDSFDINGKQQKDNLRELIKFKRDNPDRVVLLIGNHDHHYWPGVVGEAYSGYQSHNADEFKAIYTEAQDLFQIAYTQMGIFFTHAGVTESFLTRLKIKAYGFTMHEQVKRLNDRYNKDPNVFNFYPLDFSGNGSDIGQTCIWVRPRQLNVDGVVVPQVVGHTRQQGVVHKQTFIGGHPYYFIDTLEDSGNPEYLLIEDGNIQIKKVHGEGL